MEEWNKYRPNPSTHRRKDYEKSYDSEDDNQSRSRSRSFEEDDFNRNSELLPISKKFY